MKERKEGTVGNREEILLSRAVKELFQMSAIFLQSAITCWHHLLLIFSNYVATQTTGVFLSTISASLVL